MRKLVFILLFFLSTSIFAISKKGGDTRSTRVGFIQQNYTGLDKQSFSGGSPSYGAELSINSGGRYFRYFFSTSVVNSIGSQNFISSGTTYLSKYVYTAVVPEIGVMFFPISKNDNGVSIYVWGAGGISYNNLTINSVPTGSNVKSKAQEFGSGYGAGMGVELNIYTSRGGKRMIAYSEVGFRDYRASLAGLSAFEVSGMTFSVGFGF